MLNTKHTLILKWLARYKYLNINQIHRHFYHGKTKRNTEITLKRLEEKSYIHRMSFPRSSNFNFGMVCYLSKKGYELLLEESHFENETFLTQPVKRAISSVNHYYHRMRLVDFFIALDKSIAHFPELRLKKVLLESHQITVNTKKVVETNFMNGDEGVIADMAFALQNREGKEAVFMVEIDTGKETIGGAFEKIPVGSLLGKFKSYEKLLESEIWKERLRTKAKAFQILTVTEDETHLKTILKRVNGTVQFPQLFLGATHGQVDKENILSAPIWRNATVFEGKKLLP